MIINPLVSQTVGQSASLPSGKLQSAIDTAAASGAPQTDDTTALSTPAQLQSKTAALGQLSARLTQGYSLGQIAGQGLDKIQDTLGTLQGLAADAGLSSLGNEARRQLDAQFQEASESLGRIASETTFQGKPLLDGSLSGDAGLSLDGLLGGGGPDSVSLPDAGSLLGGADVNLLSFENSQAAFSLISEVQSRISALREKIGDYLQSLDYAAASVDSAVSNQYAASSALDAVQAEIGVFSAAAAISAQGNRLNPALVQLVG